MRFVRWTALVDQVLSNASNSLLVFLIAGTSAPESFGRFAVGYSMLAFAVGMWRNGLGYQISLRADDEDAVHIESRRALAASIAISPIIAIPVFLFTALGPGGDTGLALGLALATPFVLTQDVLRYSAVAAGDAWSALQSDLAWTVFLLEALALRMTGQGAGTLIFLWLAGAVVATGVLLWRRRLVPIFEGSFHWMADSWRGRAHLVAGSLVAGASVPLTAAIVAWIAGPAVTGGTAGAGVLMAPTNSLVAFMTLTLLASASGIAPARRYGLFRRAGLAAAVMTLGWGFILMLIPDWLGTALLGETWDLSQQAVPLIGLQYALGVLAQVATLLLVSLELNRKSHATSWVIAVARVFLGAGSSLIAATVFSVTAGQTLAMAIWLVACLWLLRRGEIQGSSSGVS